MANTTIPQVLHDVKVAYLTASGDTDTITYGNFATKVRAMSSGIPGGYVVTFKVDGNDYYIASCQQGEAITEPPTPTVEGVFLAWQLSGVDVTFPYTPSADVELTANIATVHTEIETNTAGEQLYLYNNNVVVAKTNDGMAVFGYVTYNVTAKFFFLVAQAQSNTAMSANTASSGTITYNGETWYYAHSNASYDSEAIHTAANVGDFSQYGTGAAGISAAILDYYYNV